MAESKKAKAKREKRVRDRQALARRWGSGRLGTRESIARSKGPIADVLEVPVAKLMLVIQRLNLLQKANAGIWSEPITQMVRQVLMSGTDSVSRPDHADRYMDMVTAVAREAVVVPPPDVVEVADEFGLERLEIEEAYETAQEEARNLEPGERAMAVQHARLDHNEAAERWERDLHDAVVEALRGVKRGDLKPLFVEEEPDDDQYILIVAPDDEDVDPAENECVLHRADLAAILGAVLYWGGAATPLHKFRRDGA